MITQETLRAVTCEDIANDLATAVRLRYAEQLAMAGLPLAFKANNKEMPPEALIPYMEAVNIKTQKVWNILWQAYQFGCIPKPPGSAPKVSYDPNRHCDGFQ